MPWAATLITIAQASSHTFNDEKLTPYPRRLRFCWRAQLWSCLLHWTAKYFVARKKVYSSHSIPRDDRDPLSSPLPPVILSNTWKQPWYFAQIFLFSSQMFIACSSWGFKSLYSPRHFFSGHYFELDHFPDLNTKF